VNDTLIAGLESMLSLQRWNFLPRVETWVEAENAAYVTHLAYALGRSRGFTDAQLEALLVRSLLKSLNKHFMTDINVGVREKLKARNPQAWTRLVDDMAVRAAALFPAKIRRRVHPYLMDAPGYTVAGGADAVEAVVQYAQLTVAEKECQTNARIYADEYRATLNDLRLRIEAIGDAARYDRLVSRHAAYFTTISRLGYLRRWNRINRMVSSSVLGHTYLVAVLAITCAMLAEAAGMRRKGFLLTCILRALFHDVPESLTGDIITPVKDIIATQDASLVEQVEEALTHEFIQSAPRAVQKDLTGLRLATELSGHEPHSVDSLVKHCDRMALVLECVYEWKAGVRTPDIKRAYGRYNRELGTSEWPAVREFMATVRRIWSGTAERC